MKRFLMSLAKAAACGLFVVTTLAQSATTVTTTAIQTITGAKTFSGSCKVLLAGSTSGTTCLNAPAIAGSTTQIVFPAAAGTLATLAGTETFTNKSIAYGQLTGLGSGVSTWLGTPTGANLLATVSGCSGTTTFLRADGTCATAGSTSASDLSSGTLACAREPAYTGDVTTSAGSCATTLAAASGSVLVTNVAAPSTPASGKTSVFADSTTKTLKAINDAGTLSTTVIADTGASNNFVTGISAGGVISKAQPAFTDISGTASTSQIADSAITLAKMADVATARIIGRTTASTGVPEALTGTQATALLSAFVGDSGSGGTKGLVPAPAAGDTTAYKFLKADGSFATISGGAGGGLVLVEQHTASASSSLDFTSCISSTFDEYSFRLVDIVTSTTSTLGMRASVAGTFDTGSNYYTSQTAWSTGGGVNTGPGTATSILIYPLTGRGFNTTANKSVAGNVSLVAPAGANHKNVYGVMTGTDSVATIPQRLELTAMYLSTSAVDGIRFFVSSGTFNGTIRCYGIAKS